MDGGFREWLAGLGRREALVLLVLGAIVAGGAGLWYVRALPRPVPAAGATVPVPGPTPTPLPKLLVVHVAGWVRAPGVYELPAGSRAVDAIELAGGARPGADLSSINLAALVADAQQILVVKRGAAPVAGGAAGGVATAKVNLNTATLDQLETLPGIGEVLAQRILDYRTKHGPFGAVEQLTEVSGIGEKRLADLRDQVAV